jgi:hypothetical protein
MAAATTGVTPTDLRNVRLEKFGLDADASAGAEEGESSPAGRERVCSDTGTSLFGSRTAIEGLAYYHHRSIQHAKIKMKRAATLFGCANNSASRIIENAECSAGHRVRLCPASLNRRGVDHHPADLPLRAARCIVNSEF